MIQFTLCCVFLCVHQIECTCTYVLLFCSEQVKEYRSLAKQKRELEEKIKVALKTPAISRSELNTWQAFFCNGDHLSLTVKGTV